MGGYQPQDHELELLESDIGQYGLYEGEEIPLDTPMLVEVELEEAKKKKKKAKKKNPPLNKPTRDTKGKKKYKVFVRNPKTDCRCKWSKEKACLITNLAMERTQLSASGDGCDAGLIHLSA